MTKVRIFAILALGGLMTLAAPGQTGQSSDTSVYPPTPAAESASPAADADTQYAPTSAEMIDNGAVTLVEPYDGYGEVSLDELSAALSMPAGPEPWDLGEFARWQEPAAQDAYSEPVTIIDEGQAIVGTFELPSEFSDEGEGQLATAQPQEAQPQLLPAEPAAALPAQALPAQAGAQQPVVPNTPLAYNALTRAYGDAGTVYATTAEYYCASPMYAPTYSTYYYAYPYAYASSAPPWWNAHWPLSSNYNIYPRWPDYYGIYYGYPYNSYFGTYASYPYGGYFGTYVSYPYGGYFGTYVSYPYGGYFGTYLGYPYGSYYGSFQHPRYFGSGSYLSFSFGGSSWSIYGQLGLSGYQNRHFRSSHDRDDFLRYSGSRSIARGGASSARSLSAGALVRPWRPSVSHQVAAARNGRSYDLSTDRSRLGQRGPVELGRRALTTASGAGATRATVSPRPRGQALTTGGASAMAAPVVGRAGSTLSTSPRAMTGATAQGRLQQRRDAYMDVLRRPNVGAGGAAERLSPGGNRTAFGTASPAGSASAGSRVNHGLDAGNALRRSPTPNIDTAVTAQRETMRNDLLRRLSAMPGGSGSAGALAGPTRQYNTFQPQVAPVQHFSPGESPAGQSRYPTPRSLTPRSLTPRTLTTPSATITPTPRTTSTVPSPETRFSRSTWPHNSTTTPGTNTPRTFTPRTFTPSQAAPSTSTPSRSYTPSTYTPRTFTPSQSAPSTSTSARSYTPSTFAPRTFAPSQAAPSFSQSAPSSSRFSPAPRGQSGPTMSAPPARTYSPAPSRAPMMSRNAESDSPRSQRAATDETAPRSRRR